MLPTFDDYFSKFGFGDGDCLEEADFIARDWLVVLLNQQPCLSRSGLRAYAFDSGGMHNQCRICIARMLNGEKHPVGVTELFKLEGKKLFEWVDEAVEDVLLVDDICIDNLIDEAYSIARTHRQSPTKHTDPEIRAMINEDA